MLLLCQATLILRKFDHFLCLASRFSQSSWLPCAYDAIVTKTEGKQSHEQNLEALQIGLPGLVSAHPAAEGLTKKSAIG